MDDSGSSMRRITAKNKLISNNTTVTKSNKINQKLDKIIEIFTVYIIFNISDYCILVHLLFLISYFFFFSSIKGRILQGN